MTSRAISLLVAAFLFPVATACGGAPVAATAKRDPLAPTTLYPLVAGAAWSYDVDTGQELPTLAITKVTSIRGARVEVSSGSEPVAYEVSEEGIFRPGSNTWLLRAPIAVGATWPSSSGMTATVTSVTDSVEVPAGHFAACVRVEERGGDRGQVVTTVYCPDVGPVHVGIPDEPDRCCGKRPHHREAPRLHVRHGPVGRRSLANTTGRTDARHVTLA